MPICFVVMPFKPELHYMYLFVKQHVESTYPGTSCERGDATILTVPLLEKIAAYIKQADVVIADCTGRNPNVFYELGMAHALGKPVVLLTADNVEDAPTDIRAFEFICYQGDDEQAFVGKLDKALGRLLGNQFDAAYTAVSAFFQKFRTDKHLAIVQAGKDEFTSAASAKIRTNGMPKLDEKKAMATLFLPLMVQGPPDLNVMLAINDWIQQEFGP